MNLLSFRAHLTACMVYDSLPDIAETALQDWP